MGICTLMKAELKAGTFSNS